jgi:metal-responsive CopG/Arc/MetJ family transcriptional regulator
MDMVKTRVTLPTELLREIDLIAGKKGRSAFLTEAVSEALELRQSNGTRPNQLEDQQDIAAARKNLRARTRIPWSVVKRKSKSG